MRGRTSFSLRVVAVCVAGLLTWWAPWQGQVACALEKYGRPLPEMDKGAQAEDHDDESLIGGYLLAGAFISNPSFAARPDNTGRVGMRYMLHAET
ncbi:MAG TPA: hypothetical protein VFR79_10565, partial [Nitrospira sp.]|nr:hypothetical protein [Nitrospira sp.]